jgi:hypothetical protein
MVKLLGFCSDGPAVERVHKVFEELHVRFVGRERLLKVRFFLCLFLEDSLCLLVDLRLFPEVEFPSCLDRIQ